MKSLNKLNEKIVAITMLIGECYPELLKYLNEMPITIPDKSKPEINVRILNEYYESLKNLLKTYGVAHEKNTSKRVKREK